MPRRPLVAGNWKMHKTAEQAATLVGELDDMVGEMSDVDILVCPPFPALPAVSIRLKHSRIRIGAQNMHWEAEGAYTGEVSAAMLADLCSHVIIGHSERRAMFGETDETVNRRTRAALNAGLIPIVCVGELLEENESGRTAEVVSRQLRGGLEAIAADEAARLVIAYEPVWAIGTGKAATAAGANDVIEVIIRPALEHMFGGGVAAAVRVLYGGSVKPENAAELFSQPGIDGGLIGGASLKASDFSDIVRAAV